MHRSGTSLVAHLLHRCGVYLGDEAQLRTPAADNLCGFWESRAFVDINEELLGLFEGGWDAPPDFPVDWVDREEVAALRERARAHIASFAERTLWGWKDPRTALTLPFWQGLLPALRVVVCLRHPRAVSQSLQQRNGTSIAYGQHLWLSYYEALDRALSPAARVVTHYDHYFDHPREELSRLLTRLRVPHEDATLRAAVTHVEARIRHHRATEEDVAALPVDVRARYRSLCGEASDEARPDGRMGEPPMAPGSGPWAQRQVARLARLEATVQKLETALATTAQRSETTLVTTTQRLEAALATTAQTQEATRETTAQRLETALATTAQRLEAELATTVQRLEATLATTTQMQEAAFGTIARTQEIAFAATAQRLETALTTTAREWEAALEKTARKWDTAFDELKRASQDSAVHLSSLQRQVEDLVALSRRSPWGRLRERVLARVATQPPVGQPPRLDTLHPSWTAIGERFNVQSDGYAHLAVKGTGFGPHAILVVAGHYLDTHHASDRELSASIPDGLLSRAASLPVWVDNRQGASPLSRIRCLRVLSRRGAAARVRSGGPWRRPKNAAKLLWQLKDAQSWMAQLPLRYASRAWQTRRDRLEAPDSSRSATLPPGMAAHLEPVSRPRKPDVLCFSIIDWDFRYQRPQQLLSRLARAGHRVFYLSQRLLEPGDQACALRPLAPGVTEVHLQGRRQLDIYQDALQGEHEEALYRALGEFIRLAGLAETVCLVQLPFWTPLALRLKADFGYRIVFDCLDDFSGFQNIGERMGELERRLAASADAIIASSRILAERHAARGPLLVPNAADYAHFAAVATIARPPSDRTHAVVGYYGAISHWFDIDLITRAAAARPDWRFVLIGRTDREAKSRLEGAPNIHLLDEIPYQDLPTHLATFDICLIPFIIDDLTRATNPVKFFEYLSAEKPVVAARLPELLPFAPVCYLYEGLPEFLRQTERALAEKDEPVRREAWRAVALANTWEERVGVLRRAIQGLYPRASVIVVTYNGLEMTQACVESLLRKTAYGDWELIVVDNHSSDGTVEYLQSLAARYPFVRIVRNDANRGFAAANNQGARLATGDIVVLLNNDTVVTQGWLGRLVRHLSDDTVGMVGPVTNNVGNEAKIEVAYRDMDEMEAVAHRYTSARLGQIFDVPMLALFCAAIRRPLFEKVGMLDERYDVGMFEDDDLSRSLKALGKRVVCAEDVFIHHVGGGSFGRLDPNVYREIFETNRKRYEAKWGEAWVPHRYRPGGASANPPGPGF